MSRVMLIMAIILAVTYAALARKKKGDNLNSVSSIAYILPSWAFTAVLGVESILLAPSIFDHLSEQWTFIGFLCLLGMWGVASSPYFHTEAKVMHYIGGYLFCVMAQVIVALNNPFLLLGWLPTIAYVLFSRKSDITFWAEVTAYVLLVFNLMF